MRAMGGELVQDSHMALLLILVAQRGPPTIGEWGWKKGVNQVYSDEKTKSKAIFGSK
jgi:hypothetical protein